MRSSVALAMGLWVMAVGCSSPQANPTVLGPPMATLQSLAVSLLVHSHGCDYISYARGSFTDSSGDGGCGWYGDSPPNPDSQPFDSLSRSDFLAALSAYDKVGFPVRAVSVTRGTEGEITGAEVTPDTGCAIYVYQPMWSALPSPKANETYRALDKDWYVIELDC